MGANIIQSEKRVHPSDFEENNSHYQSVMAAYRERLALMTSHGPEQAKAKHVARGKLLARERIDLLVDQNTPFLELSSFAALGAYGGAFPSVGLSTCSG